MSQFYITEAENEYVIKGNSAIVKCKLPSFVSDFVSIDSWIFDDGMVLYQNNTNETNYGTSKRIKFNSVTLVSVLSIHLQSHLTHEVRPVNREDHCTFIWQ